MKHFVFKNSDYNWECCPWMDYHKMDPHPRVLRWVSSKSEGLDAILDANHGNDRVANFFGISGDARNDSDMFGLFEFAGRFFPKIEFFVRYKLEHRTEHEYGIAILLYARDVIPCNEPDVFICGEMETNIPEEFFQNSGNPISVPLYDRFCKAAYFLNSNPELVGQLYESDLDELLKIAGIEIPYHRSIKGFR